MCYCSVVVPGKADQIRQHWTDKEEDEVAEADFWGRLNMSGFECWLQPAQDCDYMIHCLEAPAPDEIFSGLRQLIRDGHPVAKKLQSYYLDVLGVDYAKPVANPQVECIADLLVSDEPCVKKRGFIYPLLPAKVEDHRRFAQESSGKKRSRHEVSLRAWGIRRLTKWLQKRADETLLVYYIEYCRSPAPSSQARLLENRHSSEWLEIADVLSDHTGLPHDKLSPDVEWLTSP